MTKSKKSGILFNQVHCCKSVVKLFLLIIFTVICSNQIVNGSQIKAGVAKIDITGIGALKVHDTLYVKALVLDDGTKKVVVITVDAVAIAEIGSIRNDYLMSVRSSLEKELMIKPENVLVNASHCHGTVCSDIEQRTIRAVKLACQKMYPVNIGAGTGYEERIMENRRMKLKNGREVDSRRAYSLPPDEEVIGVGPVDPEIGILRLDKMNGQTLAVLYNFACHPIQGVPDGGNTADITGFASSTIEACLDDGSTALFLQGCAGDINPVMYKDVNNPHDAEPLGNMLGISTIQALKKIRTKKISEIKVINEIIQLPRANLGDRIDSMEASQAKLIRSLQGTTLNVKTFLNLVNKYNISSPNPSNYSHRYLHDKMINNDDLTRLDEENRNNIERYFRNIYIMEQVTRNQINIDLLKMHNAQNEASGSKTINVEVTGIRIGDFVLVSFPGELSVQIGLNIKKISPYELTFITGCSNGYIYYAPTADQLKNIGGAQEDSDCVLAPEWQKIYEAKIIEILSKL